MIAPEDPRYIAFPEVHLADSAGFLAHGGNLHSDTLICAYQQGIFPWFNDDQPILWWSPDPRLVLATSDFKCSRSLSKRIRNNPYHVTYDTAFSEVIAACAAPRSKQAGDTWLNSEMRNAYLQLHEMGYAHSIECWQNQTLVGGLYGVAINKLFFGESMFSQANDSSKIALYYLCQFLQTQGVAWIDCQVETDHLMSLGATFIPRTEFITDIHQVLHENEQIQWDRFAELLE